MTACLLCGAANPEVFLDLGLMPLANKFLTREDREQEERVFPLRTAYCHQCGHVQLAELVPPQAMFEDYLYISSVSQTLKTHLHGLADLIDRRHQLRASDLVVDIGCNDGTLLEGFRARGIRVLGVDPARNLAPLSRGKGIDVEIAFFGEAVGRFLRKHHGPAKIITMTNAFPHLPDLADLLRGIDALLADDGVFVIETHYLRDMFEQVAFDTIYHEHVSYWALRPMIRLFSAFDFDVVAAERLPLHHGQLRVSVRRKGRGTANGSVAAIVEQERASELSTLPLCQQFARSAFSVRDDLRRFLADAQSRGKMVAAYGAPAKGNTLLGFLGREADGIAWIADRSLLKQGRFAPGSHLEIVPPERILEDMPDYLLVLCWNFIDEIIVQQIKYRENGGKFVLPLPDVRIL